MNNSDNATPWPEVPARLCHYMRLQYLEPILKRSVLFFPKPASFNDPFDSKIFPDFEASVPDRRKHYDAILESQGLSRSERRREIEELSPIIDDGSLFEDAFTQTIEEFGERFGILCLAETNGDILMWSHYADRHAGVCLIFNTSNVFFKMARKVAYEDDYPSLNFADFSKMMMDIGAVGSKKDAAEKLMVRTLFLTKAKHWKYEQEWRATKAFSHTLDRTEKGEFFSFPSESLVEIILGAKTTEADAAAVRTWIKAGPCEPRLLKATVSKRRFALNMGELFPNASVSSEV
jgi:hypothetical protein